MLTQENVDELTDSVIEVLDVQAFMFAETAAPQELETPMEDCCHASISFSGPTCGSIDMVFPQEVCAELAANILGVEAEEIEGVEEAGDALKELLNITCGQFLTKRFGSEPVFSLSIPQVEVLDVAGWEEWAGRSGIVGFEVDFSPILVDLTMEEQ